MNFVWRPSIVLIMVQLFRGLNEYSSGPETEVLASNERDKAGRNGTERDEMGRSGAKYFYAKSNERNETG